MKDNKNNYLFERISEETLIIFLHGYKGDCRELPCLKDFLTKEKKVSFFAPTYGKRGNSNEVLSIKKVETEILRSINKVLSKNHFKKIYLLGYSLGAALALMIAVKTQINGLILISLFDDRKKLLMKRGIIIDESENITPVNLVKQIKDIPIVLIHGIYDQSIPYKKACTVFKELNKEKSALISLKTTHYYTDADSKKELINGVSKALKICSL